MSNKKNSLSKSTLIRSIQCSKSLFLYKNNYSLRDKPNTTQQQRFDRGHRVGKLAHQLFPNGKDCSPPNPFSYDESIAATKHLVQQQFPVIYEAAFRYNGIMAALDILECKKDKWFAYEVKSSFRISNTYLLDAAIQYYIITRSGLKLDDFFLVTIDNEYVLNGELEPENYFKKTSVLTEIEERIPYIEKCIEKAILILESKTIPEISIGQHCSKPYPCDFQGYCWKDIPQDSIWYLPGISAQEKITFIEKGIFAINQIEETDDLSERQKVIIKSYQQQKPYIKNEKLKEFFNEINYPLYFFDVEAFQPAVPLFNNTKPYQRIPFLYSLHYKKDEQATLQHIDYISSTEDDRINFIKHFLNATKNEGKILVFNTLMEKGILFNLMKDFPEFKHEIFDRINRIIDVEIPFKELYYYHPKQHGSFSLKAIGNAVLGRDEFMKSQVKDGEEAMAIYNELFYADDKNAIQQKLKDLKTYCQTDTLVLFHIFEKLKKIVQK